MEGHGNMRYERSVSYNSRISTPRGSTLRRSFYMQDSSSVIYEDQTSRAYVTPYLGPDVRHPRPAYDPMDGTGQTRSESSSEVETHWSRQYASSSEMSRSLHRQEAACNWAPPAPALAPAPAPAPRNGFSHSPATSSGGDFGRYCQYPVVQGSPASSRSALDRADPMFMHPWALQTQEAMGPSPFPAASAVAAAAAFAGNDRGGLHLIPPTPLEVAIRRVLERRADPLREARYLANYGHQPPSDAPAPGQSSRWADEDEDAREPWRSRVKGGRSGIGKAWKGAKRGFKSLLKKKRD